MKMSLGYISLGWFSIQVRLLQEVEIRNKNRNLYQFRSCSSLTAGNF